MAYLAKVCQTVVCLVPVCCIGVYLLKLWPRAAQLLKVLQELSGLRGTVWQAVTYLIKV